MKKPRKSGGHRPERKAPHYKKLSRSRKQLRRFKAVNPGSCTVADGCITWWLPRKLMSLNALRGRMSRFWDNQAWLREIESAVMQGNDGSLGKGSGLKLRLEITRLAPTDRWRLDKCNLYGGGIKQLEDVLVSLGYLVDDSDDWCDLVASQSVSTDGKYWTVVRLVKP